MPRGAGVGNAAVAGVGSDLVRVEAEAPVRTVEQQFQHHPVPRRRRPIPRQLYRRHR